LPRAAAVGTHRDAGSGSRTVTVTHIAGRKAVEHDLFLGAFCRLFKGHRQRHRHVSTLQPDPAAGGCARYTAEEGAEQVAHVESAAASATEKVVQVDVLVPTRPALTASSRTASDGAETVVLLTFLRVRQHVVGLVDLFEALFCVRSLVDVWMQFAGLATEGLLDLITCRRTLDAERCVVVSGTCGHMLPFSSRRALGASELQCPA